MLKKIIFSVLASMMMVTIANADVTVVDQDLVQTVNYYYSVWLDTSKQAPTNCVHVLLPFTSQDDQQTINSTCTSNNSSSIEIYAINPSNSIITGNTCEGIPDSSTSEIWVWDSAGSLYCQVS